MRHFTYKTLAELDEAARQLGAEHVHFEHDTAKMQAALSRKVKVCNRVAGNSMAIHPMEGCDGTLEGRPDELTWRRYERFARGGAKLIWFEATAIREDGRANPRQGGHATGRSGLCARVCVPGRETQKAFARRRVHRFIEWLGGGHDCVANVIPASASFAPARRDQRSECARPRAPASARRPLPGVRR